jgi:ribosomal 50S subunit-associated protein YjgA (DUF615 family)
MLFFSVCNLKYFQFPQAANLTEFYRNSKVNGTEDPVTWLLSSYMKRDALEVDKTGKECLSTTGENRLDKVGVVCKNNGGISQF